MPPMARVRPTVLQALLRLPPRSTSRFILAYESSYLWYTEYPSDAHRGFEVPGATVVLIDKPASEGSDSTPRVPASGMVDRYGYRLKTRTTSTLISLPTPDFSMPYNVIILTSTVVALFFGSVVNALLRHWLVVSVVEEDEQDESGVQKTGAEKSS